ncbi:hypothetical protein CN492_25065, partial [Priestia megaterium]
CRAAAHTASSAPEKIRIIHDMTFSFGQSCRVPGTEPSSGGSRGEPSFQASNSVAGWPPLVVKVTSSGVSRLYMVDGDHRDEAAAGDLRTAC